MHIANDASSTHTRTLSLSLWRREGGMEDVFPQSLPPPLSLSHIHSWSLFYSQTHLLTISHSFSSHLHTLFHCATKWFVDKNMLSLTLSCSVLSLYLWPYWAGGRASCVCVCGTNSPYFHHLFSPPPPSPHSTDQAFHVASCSAACCDGAAAATAAWFSTTTPYSSSTQQLWRKKKRSLAQAWAVVVLLVFVVDDRRHELPHQVIRVNVLST